MKNLFLGIGNWLVTVFAHLFTRFGKTFLNCDIFLKRILPY